MRRPLNSQELQLYVDNLSDQEGRDFSDFSDIDPTYGNSDSENSEDSSDSSDDADTDEDIENQTVSNILCDQYRFIWNNYHGNHKNLQFTGKEGIQIDLPQNFTPIQAFALFFSPELLTLLVSETNRYAAYVISNTNITRKSRLNQWHPTNEQEIKKFVGLYI